MATVAAIFFTACKTSSKHGQTASNNTSPSAVQQTKTDVAYTIAKNYFVNNTVTQLDNPKIETQAKFNETFGMATRMGSDGRPTAIDFAKQNVIAVILPETNMETTVTPISLQKDDKGNLLLTYKTVVGEKKTYTAVPFFAIIIDKSETGNIILRAIK